MFGKLRDAKAAVKSGNVFLINQDAIAADAIDLEYDIGNELFEVLDHLLEETTLDQYAGSRPPQKSYDQEIKGLELFAFVVDSRRFQCRVYFKFTIIEETLWLVSLHHDRPIKESS